MPSQVALDGQVEVLHLPPFNHLVGAILFVQLGNAARMDSLLLLQVLSMAPLMGECLSWSTCILSASSFICGAFCHNGNATMLPFCHLLIDHGVAGHTKDAMDVDADFDLHSGAVPVRL